MSNPQQINDYNVKISRFTSDYPPNNPDSAIVGFTIISKNNRRSTYKETRVFYKDIKHHGNEEQIVELAWNQIKPFFISWLNENKKKGTLLGKVFTPFL